MQFAKVFLAAAAFAVANAVQFTDPTFAGITAGTPFNITWTGASGAVTLTLKNGPATNLQTVSTIASGLTGTSFTWTPSASLPSDTYAIQIEDSTGIPNYSTEFQLLGGSTSSMSSMSSSMSMSTMAANSTTSTVTASTTANSTSTATSTKSGSTASKTSASGSTGTSSSTSTPSNANSASGLASPLAMVFLALAAFVSLN